jgi:lysophospholipase L1-like esterase
MVVPMRNELLSLALSPVLLAQGIMTRRRVPRLPEPPGPRLGSQGEGRQIDLLIVGDSAGAGVGAPNQERALSGQLANQLAQNFRVDWQLEATTGATTQSTIQRLSDMPTASFDVALTSLGVNDVTGNLRLGEWRRQQETLRDLLRARFGVSLTVVTGLPPLHGFPALPQPLRWYLGWRASQFDHDLQNELAGHPGHRYLSLKFTENVTALAEDGFHPGQEIYNEWGRRAAAVILDHYSR